MKNLADILTFSLLAGFILLVVSVLAHAFVLAMIAGSLIIASIIVNAVRNLIAKA